jgi:F0F1-type ATP synthase assembly protein I
MTKTTAPETTPSPTTGETQQTVGGGNLNPRGEFIAAALNMSWQLAIVVLVPVIGGFELDKKLNTVPALTIVGFLLAMGGMAFVVWRQLQLYNPAAPTKEKHS